MRTFRVLLSVIAMMAATFTASAVDALYACGSFNRWDILHCVPFEKDGNVFTLTIDFSSGDIFKMSTVDCSGMHDQNTAWGAFDSGAYQTMTTPTVGIPCPLMPGVDNITAPVRESIKVTVDFDAMTITFGEGGEVTPTLPYSQTLPVMFINTEGGAPIVSKDDYLNATYYLDPMGVEGMKAFGSAEEPLPLKIKGRGNYTWTGFDKKPYRLKLDSKAALLGMKKSKHFALLAHADDSFGFLRNPVGFKISEMIGMAWTPAQQPVEVVLNGNYIGLYFLTETIRVDSDRVDIVEQPDNATGALEVTGGWLVEIDNYDSDPHITLTEADGSDYSIFFTYKTPEVLSSEQEAYLTSEMTLLNNLICGDKSSDEIWEHIDIDALARYYITQEIVDDYESFHGSCYLYKQQGEDEKWYFGPVWDFGNAFSFPKTQYIYQGRVWHQVWIGEICKFPKFMERVKEIWQEFEQNDFTELYTYVDNFSDYIATACQYDARRWPKYGNYDEAQKAQRVKEYLNGAQTWLRQQWGYNTTPGPNDYELNFIDNSETPWSQVYAYIWDPAAEGYTGGIYEPLGTWSGRLMDETFIGENAAHTLSFSTAYALSQQARVIFNNGGSSTGNQTEGFPVTNGATYTREGISGIEAIADKSVSAYATEGCIVVESSADTDVTVVTLDGRAKRYAVKAGVTTIPAAPGFYIAAGRKLIVR